MTRVYILLLLIPFVSCGQSKLGFNLQNSFLVSQKKPVCVDELNCFCFSSDSSVSYLGMYFPEAKCEQRTLIDSVEFSAYKSTLHSFKSQNNNAYVILWETEYEYFPLLIAYYIEAGKIVRIGELEISLPCQSCESFEYPIKDIRVQQKENEIEISFLKEVNYKEKEASPWKTYKPGVLRFYFNKLSKEFNTKIIP